MTINYTPRLTGNHDPDPPPHSNCNPYPYPYPYPHSCRPEANAGAATSFIMVGVSVVGNLAPASGGIKVTGNGGSPSISATFLDVTFSSISNTNGALYVLSQATITLQG